MHVINNVKSFKETMRKNIHGVKQRFLQSGMDPSKGGGGGGFNTN